MGLGASKAAPPDIDLLPPRFERSPATLDRVSLSPHEYLFGREKLDRLFTGFYTQPKGLSIRAALRPGYNEKASINLLTDISTAKNISDRFALTLGFVETDNNPTWQAQVRLGSDGSMRAAASSFDQVSGVGVYGILPADTFLDHRFKQDGSGRKVESPRFQLGCGVGGPPIRYTHVHTGIDGASSLAATVSPRTLTSVPADAASSASDVGTVFAPAMPEVGYRVVNPQQTFSAGAHLGLLQPFPFKLWMVGRHGTGGPNLTAGLGLSTDSDVLTSSRKDLQGWMAARMPAGQPRSSLSNPFFVDASLSLSEPPVYEVSLSLDGLRREAVAGYTHSMVVRRKVYNPLEQKHVKGMYNYVDLGCEFRRKLEPPFSATLAGAASWQVNRNLLLRGRFGTRDISTSVALKSWTDPAVTVCATASWDRLRSDGGIGLFIAVEKGGAVEYSKAVAGAQSVVPSRAMEARPELSQRMTGEIDNKPLLPPPVSRVSLGGSGFQLV